MWCFYAMKSGLGIWIWFSVLCLNLDENMCLGERCGVARAGGWFVSRIGVGVHVPSCVNVLLFTRL